MTVKEALVNLSRLNLDGFGDAELVTSILLSEPESGPLRTVGDLTLLYHDRRTGKVALMGREDAVTKEVRVSLEGPK